jgi:hypothetical protein
MAINAGYGTVPLVPTPPIWSLLALIIMLVFGSCPPNRLSDSIMATIEAQYVLR